MKQKVDENNTNALVETSSQRGIFASGSERVHTLFQIMQSLMDSRDGNIQLMNIQYTIA